MGKIKELIKPYAIDFVYNSKIRLDKHPTIKRSIVSVLSVFPNIKIRLQNMNITKINELNGNTSVSNTEFVYVPGFNQRANEIFDRFYN